MSSFLVIELNIVFKLSLGPFDQSIDTSRRLAFDVELAGRRGVTDFLKVRFLYCLERRLGLIKNRD